MSVVVVADNDPDALELAMTDLRLEGHDVHGARDALQAEAMVVELAPDVAVLDHRMPPGESGLSWPNDSWSGTRTCTWSCTATTRIRSSVPEPPRSG